MTPKQGLVLILGSLAGSVLGTAVTALAVSVGHTQLGAVAGLAIGYASTMGGFLITAVCLLLANKD